MLINQILSVVAVLAVGVVYGTDIFHATVVKKAAALSNDRSIADLIGHTHLIADKRMPFIGASGVISCFLLTILNHNAAGAIYSAIALSALMLHLVIYFKVAKPINARMSAAAVAKKTPVEIRAWQADWDSVIVYRAVLLTLAMVALLLGIFELAA